MNEQETHHPGAEVSGAGTSSTAVRLDEGHIIGTGGCPERFTNPGLPAHVAPSR
jgi:ubiquinol-cytochrome c reductase iron-sulfur subunit